ncbi:hypothetical protein A2165_04390 [Candidatus Curtissbacteria bacterium RBG_13_40_7]|uniref:Uncharacterized protein n=1 Tax=Candidatus Curtissbacteria bacterium RBG_13_40_7 TaxID=1797706 RepID=A0A1F5FYX7_9BACT|nr:MAG: hypothetical protein A2165_04390 [Candidatus Curtissbacteria bacterium RBG_13_40_7]
MAERISRRKVVFGGLAALGGLAVAATLGCEGKDGKVNTTPTQPLETSVPNVTAEPTQTPVIETSPTPSPTPEPTPELTPTPEPELTPEKLNKSIGKVAEAFPEAELKSNLIARAAAAKENYEYVITSGDNASIQSPMNGYGNLAKDIIPIACNNPENVIVGQEEINLGQIVIDIRNFVEKIGLEREPKYIPEGTTAFFLSEDFTKLIPTDCKHPLLVNLK